MKKIILILPYFGKFPNYFNLWLESIRRNPTIDLLLITDNKEIYNYDLPNNIKIELSTLSKLKKKIEKNLNKSIIMHEPYKICDFRPAYGVIFSDKIKLYDFWGYLDADIILGDIRYFLTDEILSKYEKIFSRGHFTLFKNSEKMNSFFEIDHKYTDCFHFSDVIKYRSLCAYDEWGWNFGHGISEILKREQFETFDKILFADVSPESFYFKLVGREKEDIDFFKYVKGKIFGVSKNKVISEYIYIHLQKREMVKCEIGNLDEYYIYPNQFCDIKLNTNDYRNYENEFYKRLKRNKYKVKLTKINIDYLLLRMMMFKRKKGLTK